MEEKVLKSAKSYFKHQVDIDKFKKDTMAKLELNAVNSVNVKGIHNKIIYFSGAALLALSIFIGSAFVSPAMAQVVAKVPFLGQILGMKNDVLEQIQEELIAKGYKTTAGVSYPEKVISISVDGSEQYFDQVKNDVHQIAANVLHSNNYDAYEVEVVLSRPKDIEDKLNEAERSQVAGFKEQGKIIDSIYERLQTQGYHIQGMSYDLPKELEITIPNTETRITGLEQIVRDILKENGIAHVPLKVKKVDMAEMEMDQRWREILDLVGEDILGKKEYKVRMVGYSIHPEPEIQAFITLSGESQETKGFAKQLEKIINDFLQTKEMKSKVGNDSYHITIYNNENEKVN